MPPPPRGVDFAIGVSIIAWATAGITSAAGTRPSAVLVATACLHLTVAILFFVRRPATEHGDWSSCMAAVPAVLVGGWVLLRAPAQWAVVPQGLFVAGCGLAIVSLAILGRCFAVLPAVRGIVVRGPYAIVRHPAYLGELVMVIACVMAAEKSWMGAIVLAGVIAMFIARILAEERLLSRDPNYQRYRAAVRWRMIPWLW